MARWRRLVRVYAGVEVLLGFLGLVFHAVFLLMHDPLLEMNTATRWLAATGMILPQSILLGISFPVMSAGLMRRLRHEQERVLGNLYFTNSAGAALGALVATFVLLPRVGLPGSLQFAGLLNLLIGVFAWLLGSEAGEPIRARASMTRSSARTSRGCKVPGKLLLRKYSGQACLISIRHRPDCSISRASSWPAHNPRLQS
ncbi:MAG: hypothetical protein U5L08_09660 [Xanthomonadales bacterium]|nr:hypothetical protein [Xanthomonadales bacterium]